MWLPKHSCTFIMLGMRMSSVCVCVCVCMCVCVCTCLHAHVLWCMCGFVCLHICVYFSICAELLCNWKIQNTTSEVCLWWVCFMSQYIYVLCPQYVCSVIAECSKQGLPQPARDHAEDRIFLLQHYIWSHSYLAEASQHQSRLWVTSFAWKSELVW